MKSIVMVILTALALHAQEAKVLLVDPSDSQKLAKVYQEYKDALKRWEEAKALATKKYTYTENAPTAGWEKVQFSPDFRVIIPEPEKAGKYITSGIGTTATCIPWNYYDGGITRAQ